MEQSNVAIESYVTPFHYQKNPHCVIWPIAFLILVIQHTAPAQPVDLCSWSPIQIPQSIYLVNQTLNSLLCISLNKPICAHNIQILLFRPISNTMSDLARSPMLAFIRRCQVRGVALQDH